jgi:hypothetical protein
VLAVGDGALGFWKAIRDVFPDTKEQRCWWHKIGNVLAGPRSRRTRPRRRPWPRSTTPRVIGKPRDQGGHETGRHVGQRELPGQVRLLDGWGAWLDSDMQGGPVDELVDVAVERPALDQLQVEVGRTLKDQVHSGLTGDDREERHLHVVDQAGGWLARANDRLPCERNGTSDSSLSRATTSTASPLTRVAFGQSRGPSSVVDTTVAGMFHIRVTHGSRTSDSSVLSASIRSNSRNVLVCRPAAGACKRSPCCTGTPRTGGFRGALRG